MDRLAGHQRARVSVRAIAAILVIALSALAQPTAATAKRIAAPKARGYVVNGGPAGTAIPWQVALVSTDGAGGVKVPFDVFCGGTLRDSTHVITAAHCVPDSSAADIAVVSNLNRRDDPGGAEVRGVTAITSHPSFSDVSSGNDLALLTLASPMSFGGSWPITNPGVDWTNAPALISGWGLLTDGGQSPLDLQAAGIFVLPDQLCGNYADSYDPSTMLCAGLPNGPATVDTCQGDSGGPLVFNNGTSYPLIGVVSFGRGCADPNFPGIYTRLSNTDLNQRAQDPNPPPRADPVTGTTVQGTPAVGQTLTCDPGQWTQPANFTFVWLSATVDAAGKPANVRGEGNAQTLPLTAAHAGRVVGCAATARGPGGSRQSGAPLVPVSAPPVVGAAPPPPPVALPRDLIAPKSRFTRRSCKKRRCSLTITASDSGGPARKVKLTFKRLSGCKKGKKGKKCRKTRTLKAKSRGKGVFTARTPRLKPAKYRFTVYATDASGNRGKKVSVALRVKRR